MCRDRNTFLQSNAERISGSSRGIRTYKIRMGGRSYLFFLLSGEQSVYLQNTLSYFPKEPFAACVYPVENADFSISFLTEAAWNPDVKRAFTVFVFEGLGYPCGSYDILVNGIRQTVSHDAAKNDTGQGIYYEAITKSMPIGILPVIESVATEGGELLYCDYGSSEVYRIFEADEPGRVNFTLLSGRLFEHPDEKNAFSRFAGGVACSLRRGDDGTFPLAFYRRFQGVSSDFPSDVAAVVFIHLLVRGVLSCGEEASLRFGDIRCRCRLNECRQVEVAFSSDLVLRGEGIVSLLFANPDEISSSTS